MTHRHIEEFYQKDKTEMTELVESVRKVWKDFTNLNKDMMSDDFFTKRNLLDLFSREVFVKVSFKMTGVRAQTGRSVQNFPS